MYWGELISSIHCVAAAGKTKEEEYEESKKNKASGAFSG